MRANSSWQCHEVVRLFKDTIPSRFGHRKGHRTAFNSTLKEVPLHWSRWIRQLHRWLSIAFTLVVIFNGVAVLKHRYTNWMGLSAVAVLALMFFTGMYLFVLPYASKWRSGLGAD